MDDVVAISDNKIDQVEKIISDAVVAGKMVLMDCPLVHTFTPGLYSRRITMPENVVVVSEIHNSEHQFNVSEGVVEVWTEGKGWEVIMAPYNGVTKPGTRRVLKVLMPCTWTTYHPNPNDQWKTPEDVYDAIIDKRINPLIKGHFKNNVFETAEKMIENDSNG